MATAAAPFQFFQVLHDPFFWSCFVAWLGSAGHTAKTARTYLAGIQTTLAEMGYDVKPKRLPLVKRTLLGLQRQPASKTSLTRLANYGGPYHSASTFLRPRRPRRPNHMGHDGTGHLWPSSLR